MTAFPRGAAAAAASLTFLAGCASQPPQAAQQQTAEAHNRCAGVPPRTGTLIRRQQDCDASTGDGVSEDLRDAIEREQRMRVPRPKDLGGG